MNMVTLFGRLVADPTVRQVGNDLTVCQFTLAVDNPGKDKGTNFFDCTAWGKQGEVISQYVKKGQQFLVGGRLKQDTWEKDGKKQSKVSIVVTDFNFVGGRSEEKTPSEEAGMFIPQENTSKGNDQISLSDIPF